MHYQHRSEQILYKDEERIDTDDLVQRQKLAMKDSDILEK